MRQILKQTYTFTSLRNVIVNKINQIDTYEKAKSFNFMSKIQKLYLLSEQNKKKLLSHQQKFQSFCLNGQKPVENIMKHFMATSDGYFEQYLVQTFVYLAKAYSITFEDSQEQIDRFSFELFEEELFQHMIEEFKYSLRDDQYITIPSIRKILDTLVEMNYCDYEILHLVMKKIENYLSFPEQNRTNFKQRFYQVEKKNYYSYGDANKVKEQILKNENFMANLKRIEMIQQKFKSKRESLNVSSEDQLFNTAQNLLSEILSLKQNHQALIQAIISIRKQYVKLCSISNSNKVQTDPFLNLDLLNLEEALVEIGLITIDDVKDPQKIQDRQIEAVEVQNIFLRLLNQRKSLPQFSYIGSQNFNEKKNQDDDQSKIDIQEVVILINSLAKYANISYPLYGQDHRINLISLEWQRQIFGEKVQTDYLPVDRIFRKAFALVYSFFKKNLPLMEYSLLPLSVNEKLYWLEALSIMGFLDQATLPLKATTHLSPQFIQQLDPHKFLIFISLLNDIGIQKTLNTEIKVEIQKKMSDVIEAYRASHKFIPYNYLISVINYLYQFENVKGQAKPLYEQFLNMLINHISYIEQNKRIHPKELEEAHKILRFQLSTEQQSSHTFSLFMNEREQFKQSNFNPYIKAVRQACLKNCEAVKEHPFILTGFNSKKEQTAIYIVNSDNSSIDGNLMNGNTRAYLKRTKENLNLIIKPMFINSFLKVDYDKNRIEFEDHVEAGKYIKRMIQENHQVVYNCLSNLIKAIQGNEKDLSLKKVKKILNRIKQIKEIMDKTPMSELSSQYYMIKYQIIVLMSQLSRDLKFLQFEELKKVNQDFSYFHGEQINKAIDAAIKQVIKSLPPLESINKTLQSKYGFEGKRTSVDLLQSIPNHFSNPEIEFMDQSYYQDKSYVQYEDWEKKIRAATWFQEVTIEDSSVMTKLLAKRFCPQAKQILNALPLKQSLVIAPYPLNWQKKYHYHVEKQHEKLMDEMEEISKTHRNHKQNLLAMKLIKLQNWKHELKMSKTPQQICQYILSFDFWKDIINKKKANQSATLLPRKEEAYLKFLQRKNDKLYLQSPYLEYIFNKLQRTERIKDLFEERKSLKVKLHSLFQKGRINKEQYFTEVENFEKKIIAEMKKLKSKVFGHVNEAQLFEQTSSLVQVEKDLNELERVLDNNHYYNRDLDEDFIHLNGGSDKNLLKVKRARAEKNLVKFYLMYKLIKDIELSQNELKQIKQWNKQIRNEITSYTSINFTTKLKIDDLSEKDREKLKLNSSDLNQIKDLALSDLILEFQNFFDLSVLSFIQKQFYAGYFLQKYELPKFIFANNRNIEFKQICYQIESQKFKQKEKLSEYEINVLKEMMRLFKTQSFEGKKRFKEIYGDLDQTLSKINNSNERIYLMGEFLKAKDYEFYNDYNVNHTEQQKRIQVEKLWQKVMGIDKADINSQQIHQTVDQICQKLIFIKKNVPAYFGLLMVDILKHPQTLSITKQKLIAYLEIFKIPLELDSNDLLDLSTEEKHKLNLDGDLRRVVGKNMTSAVSQIMSEL